MAPIISVIIPVYNGQAYLERTIRSIQSQTFQDFEVIFVDDASTDDSLLILEQACAADDRFSVIRQSHAGAGAARNRGLAAAKGEYVLFSDCDDIYNPLFLEKMYHAASVQNADITACNFIGIQKSGKEIRQTGVNTQWLLNKEPVFDYKNCPSNILRILGTNVWNKLYRKAFLLEQKLQFDEIMTCNDISFAAVSTAIAERITYSAEHLLSYHFPRQSNKKDPFDVCAAIESTVRQLSRAAHAAALQDAIVRFVLESYISALKRDITDFFAAESAHLYRTANHCFNTEYFSALRPEMLNNGKLYREFCTVRKHDYETMCQLIRQRLIVSLTTYPRRIRAVARVVESLQAQTRKPSEIVLWLAETQFPKKELELPEELLQLVERKCLTIRWCDDLKAHKKYFYALQEYADDLVVTVDDDLVYSPNLLDSLYQSYLLYPDAVSTARAHLILVSHDHKLLPYHTWIQETDYCIHTPSMQLLATGGAGVLYPPHLFRKEFFDKHAIMQHCPLADDLWLKAMEVASDVPVVLARQYEPLCYLPDTQDEALFHLNVRQNQNDAQLAGIMQWMDSKFGRDFFIRKLTNPDIGRTILGLDVVSQHIDRERQRSRRKAASLENQLQQAGNSLSLLEREKRQTEASLAKKQREVEQQKVYADTLQKEKQKLLSEKERLDLSLEQKNLSLKQTELSLKRMEQKYLASEAGKPIKVQLKTLGKGLRQQRKQRSSVSLCFRYFIYYLAWIPEKMLEMMMYYLQNGAKQTLKQIYRKLFRRKQ